jgi:hypothetical protein
MPCPPLHSVDRRLHGTRGVSEVDTEHPQPCDVHLFTEIVRQCLEGMLAGSVRPYLSLRR